MLLDGMSLAFAGMSHKLKLASLGSHLGAIGHYPLLYTPLWVFHTWSTCLKWVWLVGVTNTNVGFIAIVASVLHLEAKVRQFFAVFYLKTLYSTHNNA